MFPNTAGGLIGGFSNAIKKFFNSFKEAKILVAVLHAIFHTNFPVYPEGVYGCEFLGVDARQQGSLIKITSALTRGNGGKSYNDNEK